MPRLLPLVALLVAEDAFHSWAVEQFQELPAPFLTCEPVLTECFHLLYRLPEGSKRFFELLDRGLLTVNFVDRPYGDHDGAITPSAMRGVLATMEREQAALGRPVSRCDAAGNPT